jgi:hypothetical protein
VVCEYGKVDGTHMPVVELQNEAGELGAGRDLREVRSHCKRPGEDTVVEGPGGEEVRRVQRPAREVEVERRVCDRGDDC